ncbi:unnamed protein product, partial [Closterium sp. NIES-54]
VLPTPVLTWPRVEFSPEIVSRRLPTSCECRKCLSSSAASITSACTFSLIAPVTLMLSGTTYPSPHLPQSSPTPVLTYPSSSHLPQRSVQPSNGLPQAPHQLRVPQVPLFLRGQHHERLHLLPHRLRQHLLRRLLPIRIPSRPIRVPRRPIRSLVLAIS